MEPRFVLAICRLKVAKLLFARYMAQTPTHDAEEEEEMENGSHLEEKTNGKKKKKKKRPHGISVKTKDDKYKRPSVFDAIKQRNKNRRLQGTFG